MANLPKQFVIGAWIVAGLVTLFALLDLINFLPFSTPHTKTMDIIFLISCGILAYLGWEAYKDLG